MVLVLASEVVLVLVLVSASVAAAVVPSFGPAPPAVRYARADAAAP